MIFEQVYKRPRLIEIHEQAPLRTERELYLRHMLEEGYSREVMTTSANYILHIVRILGMTELRVVHEDEIERAADIWAKYRGPFRDPHHRNCGSPKPLIKYARAWLRFHGKLAVQPQPAFQELVQRFSDALRSNYGLAVATIHSYSSCAQIFLRWLAVQGADLKTADVADIDKFIDANRREGRRSRTIAHQCQALRSFLRFAEMQGWCRPNLALSIRIPRLPRDEPHPTGPTWAQVRQVLKLAQGSKPEHLRARALLLLFIVYGLRSSEVIELRLEDIDWRSEVLTVRRAKHGGTQQYPIQYEVGDAILKYLRHARPHVNDRHVFLGERRPWGPLLHGSVWRTVSLRLRTLGIKLDHLGPHSLRHSCATRLLQQGSSLREIADFLGHRNTKSVGMYAKLDIKALRKVSAFRLSDLQ